MLYYIVVALLLLHTMFWGAGLSWLVLPRAWRSVWWIFAPTLGFGLQSAVVWAGAHTALPGTDAYAAWSEALPVGLLVWATAKFGLGCVKRRVAALGRAWPVLVLMGAAGLLLLWPMAQRGAWTLTSSSLGSCDHADYAAGARVFREFARDSDEGFLGLGEVTSVGSARGFFEFWLKLNHFTPSALIAHNATVLQLPAYQLVSVSGVVALLATVPLVVLLARQTGLRAGAPLVVAALYAFSPLSAYAVHQGALGQLYGAHGIAVLTLVALDCARSAKEGWRFAMVALAAFWLLAGAYNFIITVALAPAAAWLLLRTITARSGREWPRVAGVLVVAFAMSMTLFWGRYVGVVERFELFERFDFGWPVPHLWPGAWLGFVADPALHPPSLPWAVITSAWVVVAWLIGTVVCWRRNRSVMIASIAFVVPVAIGWMLLLWESRSRANASYDAFKILSVFLPVLLAGSCIWLGLGRGIARRWIFGGGMLVLVANLWVGSAFAHSMMSPPLRVDRSIAELRRLEGMPRVTSLNMRIESFWARLWANYFLLRKPQYFATHTYEGRLNTELKGEWDLSDGLLHSIPRRSSDYLRVNEQFHLERVGAPGRVRLEFGQGWHPIEGSGANRWRWSGAEARVRVTNPDKRALRVTLQMNARSTTDNAVVIRMGKAEVGRGLLSSSFRSVEVTDLILPPGESDLVLAIERPVEPAADDKRVLGLALSRLTIAVVASSR